MSRKLVSLFTGAGGLDLGLELAGFSHTICVENDASARATLAHNRPAWRLSSREKSDITAISAQEVLQQAGIRRGEPALLAGGPPCQPFSKASLWANGTTRGLTDPRAETLRCFLSVAAYALPEVILIENVPGFRRSSGQDGVSLINDRLEEINKVEGTSYTAQVFEINAADYGVPQRRTRLFVVAHRLGRQMQMPELTHAPAELATQLRRQKHLTAWDAIGDLDSDTMPEDLLPRGKYGAFLPSIPEGQNYLWHTPEGIKRSGCCDRGRQDAYWGWRTRYWSFLLKLAKRLPAWTISASPGPSTGPFHWRSRHLSIRELCRLQTFPDSYEVVGQTYRERVRQLGNAVPCALGELIGLEIRRQLLLEKETPRRVTLLPRRRGNCPPPEPVEPVPAEYDFLRGFHEPHPGAGKGPGISGNGQR